MAKLTANPSAVLIDPDKAPTGTASVSYELEPGQTLWTRLNKDEWAEQPTAQDDVPIRFGALTSPPLRPGDVFTVLIAKPGTDPHRAELFAARVTVCGLLRGPGPASLIQDSKAARYGTWCRYGAKTSVPTVAVLQVSRTPWASSPEGFLSFADVLQETGRADLALDHDLGCYDLWPGNTYYMLLRISDEQGRWQFAEPREIVMRQRVVTVAIKEIFIDDDSDDWKPGQGSFGFELKAGPGDADPHRAGDWHSLGVGTSFQDLTIDTGQLAQLGPERTLTFGPFTVDETNRSVCLETSGSEDDSPDPDDRTTTERYELFFRVGQLEVMTDAAYRELKTHDLRGDLRYTARFTFGVDYQ